MYIQTLCNTIYSIPTVIINSVDNVNKIFKVTLILKCSNFLTIVTPGISV